MDWVAPDLNECSFIFYFIFISDSNRVHLFQSSTHSVEEAIDTAKVAIATDMVIVHLYESFHVMGFSGSLA
jgi:hypothetical protein